MEGRRQALLVATSDYADPSFQELRAPSGDVDALAEVLADPEIGGFDVRDTVLNEPKGDICVEIEDFFDGAKASDLLLLYLSCHGVLSPDRRLYFAARDTKFKRLRSTGISESFVNEVMQHSRANSILLILDCCHSGAFGRDLVGKGGPQTDLAHRFDGRGRVTLTASTALEYAFEDTHSDPLVKEAPSSVFTRVLVEGLRSGEADENNDGHVSLDELYDYLYEGVKRVTPHQTPELTGKFRGDLYLAKSPHGPVDLPEQVRAGLDSHLLGERLAAVTELARYVRGDDRRLARSAEQALGALEADDSRAVSAAATDALARLPGRRGGRPAPAREAPPRGPEPEPEPEPRPAPPEPAAPGRRPAGEHADALRRGEEALREHRANAALTHFERILAVDPESLDALTGAGLARLARHRIGEAAADFDRVLRLDPDFVRALVGRSRAHAARWRLGEALADADRALALEPGSVPAHVARARALTGHLRTEQMREALLACDAALRLDPQSAEALAWRAYALSNLDDDDAAIADAAHAIELAPRLVEARVIRAQAHIGNENWDAAAPDVDEALGLDHGSPDVRATLAMLRFGQERFDEGMAEIDRALDLNPDHAIAVLFRGLFNIALERVEDALRDVQRSRRLFPRSGLPCALLGAARVMAGDGQSALRELDRAFELDPEFATLAGGSGMLGSVYGWRGYAHLALDRPEEALAEFDRALGEAPRSVDALTGHATALARLERYEPALADTMRVFEIEPGNEVALDLYRRIVSLLAETAPARLPPAIRVEVEQARERNRELLGSANIEGGFYPNQKRLLLEQITGTEQLLWLCRCSRGNDVFRSVVLVLTSEKLLWCRETMFGTPEWRWVKWGIIVQVDKEANKGFTINTSENVTATFTQILGGIDLSGDGLSLDADGVRAAVRQLAGLPPGD